MKKIVLAASTFLVCLSSGAQESVATRIHNFYQSPRAMGMGNAYSAIADDYAAMFYNASMLVYRKNSEFQMNIISAGLATDTLSLSKEVKDASDSVVDQNDDNAKANAISQVLENYYGKPLGFRLSPMEFIWVSPNWGLSLIVADTTADIAIHRQVGPALDLYLIKDTSINYSYAWFLGKESSMGFLAKFNHRNEMANQFAALDLALDSKIIDFKNSKEGMNFDFDIGYTWKPIFSSAKKVTAEDTTTTTSAPPPPVEEVRKPTQAADETAATETVEAAPTPENPVPAEKVEKAEKIAEKVEKTEKAEEKVTEKKSADEIDTKTDGVQINTKKVEEKVEEEILYQPLALTAVLRNVISMGYSKATMVNKDATDKPRNNDRVLDIGASYALFDYAYTQFKIAAEAKNLMHPEASVYKCAHFGVEYTLGMDWLKLQLRAGMNQAYFTAGFGINLGPLDIEAATYGEEYGTDKARVQNRVNAVTVALKF